MQLENGTALDDLAGCCPSDSLFERYAWFYALCREHLFHDHSPEIARTLWGTGEPPAGLHLVELGCGPGFYACRFAERFPQIRTTGIDLSTNLLAHARSRAERMHLSNASFLHADVHALPAHLAPVDLIVVSRLFLIVPNREDVLREVFRVLRPGGTVVVAEPLAGVRTQMPLSLMWLLAKLTSFSRKPYVEPHKVRTMSAATFERLLLTQPWQTVERRRDGRYQMAFCRKPEQAAVPETDSSGELSVA